MREAVPIDYRGGSWRAARPHVLVVACSDGRLQEETDRFLGAHLGIAQYDRLYLPGGAGALSPSGRDFTRAYQLRRECQFLIESHQVTDVVLLFHGPSSSGPHEASCADYRRKLAWGNAADLRAQQERDADELVAARHDWALDARLHVFRCEVDRDGDIGFVCLFREAEIAAEPVRDEAADGAASRDERPLGPGART